MVGLNLYEVCVSLGHASVNLTKSTFKMSPKCLSDDMWYGPKVIDIPDEFGIDPPPLGSTGGYGLRSNFAWNSMQAANSMRSSLSSIVHAYTTCFNVRWPTLPLWLGFRCCPVRLSRPKPSEVADSTYPYVSSGSKGVKIVPWYTPGR